MIKKTLKQKKQKVMRRFSYKKRRYFGKGQNLIRPTLNKGRIFVGEGFLKKRHKKKRVYGKGFIVPLLLSSVLPGLIQKIVK